MVVLRWFITIGRLVTIFASTFKKKNAGLHIFLSRFTDLYLILFKVEADTVTNLPMVMNHQSTTMVMVTNHQPTEATNLLKDLPIQQLLSLLLNWKI